MTYGQHVKWGIVTYFIVIMPIFAWILYRQDWSAYGLEGYWWELLICFGLCVIGAMTPDIDIKSRSQRVIYAFLILLDVLLILFSYYRAAALLGFFAMLPNIAKHRGKLHSLPAAILIPAPLLIIPLLVTGELTYRQMGITYYISGVSGYISHLIADGIGSRKS
ncbi:hypothetical protein FJZ33_02000 [Candidatus Poribacteria bacterium]|nr:hypothetical protein [Candidatus Poribacteria bacterium]